MNKRIRIAPNVSWTVIENELFVFEEISDSLYILKQLSKDFVLSCINGISHEQLLTQLLQLYKSHRVEDFEKRVEEISVQLQLRRIIVIEDDCIDE